MADMPFSVQKHVSIVRDFVFLQTAMYINMLICRWNFKVYIMGSFTDLKSLTQEFFEIHWNRSSKQTYPIWSDPWLFDGPVPNNELKACYAFLLDSGEVVYIGVALNSGLKGYEGHSLGTRISKYWALNKATVPEVNSRRYKPSSRIEGNNIDSIAVLAFPPDEQEYLAASLEIFLIKSLRPNMNKIYKS